MIDKSKNSEVFADGRTFDAVLEFENDSITDGFYSIKVAQKFSDDTDSISIGSSCATQVDVELVKSDIAITGNEFTLYFVLNDYRYKMGVFTAQKPTVKEDKMTFTAYDRMASAVLQQTYVSKLKYPCDIKDVLHEIEDFTGINIIGIDSLPDIEIQKKVVTSEETTAYSNPFDGYTYRTTLGIIAGRLGKCATFNRDGDLEFRWYSKVDYTVDDDMTYEPVEVSEEPFTIQYLQCAIGDGTNIQSGSGATGVVFSNLLYTQDLLDALFEDMKDFSYYDLSLSMKGDPRLDLGDIINTEINGGTNSFNMPIMAITHTFDGGLSTELSCYASTEQTSANFVSPTQIQYEAMQKELATVKELVVNKKITVGDIDGLQIGVSNLLDYSRNLAGYKPYVELCDHKGVQLCDSLKNPLCI